MSDTQNTAPNDKIAYIVVIILLVVIAVLAYFLGKDKQSDEVGKNASSSPMVENSVPEKSEIINKVTTYSQSKIDGLPGDHIEVTYIGCDQRDSDCYTQETLSQIMEMNSFMGSAFTQLDMNEKEAQALIDANGVTGLPVAILNTNDIANPITKDSLKPWENGKFVWELGDGHPYKSARWLDVLKPAQLASVTSPLNVYNNPNANILWIEYSDIQCGYCQKLHNEGTQEQLFEIFGKDLSYAYTYFPIFNEWAPQAFECILEQTDKETWYNVIKKSYQNSFREINEFASLVPTLDRTKFDACVSEGKYTQKIQEQAKVWGFYARSGMKGLFKVTGTPWNILINKKTGEFIALSGAQPISQFEQAITYLNAVQ